MITAIRNRRSIRRYKEQPVSDQIVRQVIESALLAPSGRHTQPWHFIVIRDPKIKAQVVSVSGDQKWMNAPVFIACIADIRARIPEGKHVVVDELSPGKELKLVLRDTAIAIEHLVLEAVDQGLGTCWVAHFQQDAIREVLNVPKDKYVVSVITLGYPDEVPADKARKGFAEVVHFEKW